MSQEQLNKPSSLTQYEIEDLGFTHLKCLETFYEFDKGDLFLVWDSNTGTMDITEAGAIVYYGKPDSKESLKRILDNL